MLIETANWYCNSFWNRVRRVTIYMLFENRWPNHHHYNQEVTDKYHFNTCFWHRSPTFVNCTSSPKVHQPMVAANYRQRRITLIQNNIFGASYVINLTQEFEILCNLHQPKIISKLRNRSYKDGIKKTKYDKITRWNWSEPDSQRIQAHRTNATLDELHVMKIICIRKRCRIMLMYGVDYVMKTSSYNKKRHRNHFICKRVNEDS